MKVFIAGATGVLGRRLVKRFSERGHNVIGLVRSLKGERQVKSMGGDARRADLFNSDSLAKAADGCDVVIHAATAIPVKRRTIPQDWAMNDQIRREGTRSLCECAGRIGARHYLQQSIVWVARPADGSPFDEEAPIRPDPLVQSAADSEAIAREAGAKFHFTAGVLRGGSFYGPDAAHTRIMGEGLLKRRLGIIGETEAVWAMIHVDDFAATFLVAAEKPVSGLWHIVDDELVTVPALLRAFAAKLGAKPPRNVPIWLARLIAGDANVNFFTRTTRTSNARFRRDFGWTPMFPTYREGLDQIVAAWKAQHFLL